MHDLHYFLLILRSESKKKVFYKQLHYATVEKKIINILINNCSYEIFN